MNLLIGESGGTKTDWVIVKDGITSKVLQTRGLSPSLSDWETIREIILEDVASWASDAPPQRLYFFGAGLGRRPAVHHMKRLLGEVFTEVEEIHVDTDLVGSGYAGFGNNSGLVAIMGTGSVAFRYGNGKITDRRGGWGYLLADEGGGFSLGRALLRGLLEGQFSQHIVEAHEAYMDHSLARTIQDLYNHTRPSLYLARQVPFLAQQRKDEEIRILILSQIQYFLDHYLLPIASDAEEDVVFTGGVARIFHDLIIEACKSRSIDTARVLKEPPVRAIARYLLEQAL